MRVTTNPAAARSILIATLVICTDIGFARLGYGLVLPAIRRELGGAYALYGALGAVHLGGYLAGTIAAPWVLRDRSRLPRITALTHGAIAACIAWSAAARDPLMLGAARACLGIASGIGIASAITDALQRAPERRRGIASALAWSGIGIGLALSAPAAAWTLAAPANWRIATLLCTLPALAIVALAATQPAIDAPRGGPPALLWPGLARVRNVFFAAAYGAYGAAYISYATFAVATFAADGIAPRTLSLTWFVFGVACVAGTLAIGRVLDGPAHRWALALPLATGVAGALISALGTVPGAIGGALCVGAGLAAAPAVASAFARDRSDAATYVSAFAGVTMVFGIGQIAGPLVAGAAADRFTLNAVPMFSAAVFALGTACATVDALLAPTRAHPEREPVS